MFVFFSFAHGPSNVYFRSFDTGLESQNIVSFVFERFEFDVDPNVIGFFTFNVTRQFSPILLRKLVPADRFEP